MERKLAVVVSAWNEGERVGDTLAAVAEETGIPVEKLQELNPELDPQNLIVGQRIRLRE